MPHPLNEQHSRLERRPIWFLAFVTVAVSIGGLVELVPILTAQSPGHASTLEAQAAALVKPRTPLQQEGFDIYVREGCSLCHSQMVRPFRWETLRFGPYSLAADAQYDHPFVYGSRRIGPDLSHVGGKYPDAWHVQHMRDPRSVVPTSLMPAYPWLEKTKLDGSDIQAKMRALREVGVPYTDQQIADAPQQLVDKTELDAVIAYLQSLGQATKDLKH